MESIIFRKGFDKKRALKLPVSESLNASILMKQGLHPCLFGCKHGDIIQYCQQTPDGLWWRRCVWWRPAETSVSVYSVGDTQD